MKRMEIIRNSKGFALGYEEGKKFAVEKIIEFINEECEFIPDITSDMLLDRLVKVIKKI